MQTLAALWGLTFVVYVFVSDYYFRERGTASVGGAIVHDIDETIRQGIPRERQLRQSGGGQSPSSTQLLRISVGQIPGVLDSIRRNHRVFRRILVSGILVILSILIDVGVMWSNDATYLGLAIWAFVLALVFLAFILSWEVHTNVSQTRTLALQLMMADQQARAAYDQAVKDIPDQR